MNSMEGGHYYCAYPEASTRMVKGTIEVRERFDRLRREARRGSARGVQGRVRAVPDRVPGAPLMAATASAARTR